MRSTSWPAGSATTATARVQDDARAEPVRRRLRSLLDEDGLGGDVDPGRFD